MPLRAVSDHGDVHAFAFDDERWAELKATYRSMNVRMPCCGVGATPKTSTKGNYFFAHARRGECATAPESAEHIHCKTLIAKAALSAGWTVRSELPGVTPDGESWVADVFCEKGKTKLAFEVQISPQSFQETKRRQIRYEASGVRAAWFFGHKAGRIVIPVTRETPVFRLSPFLPGDLPTVEGFDLSLPEFVAAMLQKRLRWTVPRYSSPHLVHFLADRCWSCGAPVKQVLEHMRGHKMTGSAPLTPEDFYAARWNPSANTVPSLSNRLEAIQADISNEELAAQGLNLVGRKDVINGKITRFPFCNLCIHCRAPQNNFHLTERIAKSMQWRMQSDEDELIEVPSGNASDSSEAAAGFGVALIPREIEGAGRWEIKDPVDLVAR